MSKALDPKVKVQRARQRRDERVAKLREKNLTLKQIGETVGLTGPAVYKRLNKMREHTFYGAARMSFTGNTANA